MTIKNACDILSLALSKEVCILLNGGVSERLKEAVLKTVEPLRVPWVRIPPPPP